MDYRINGEKTADARDWLLGWNMLIGYGKVFGSGTWGTSARHLALCNMQNDVGRGRGRGTIAAAHGYRTE
jgi:hypothetical protein